MKTQLCLILIAAAAAAATLTQSDAAGPQDLQLIERTCRNTPDYKLCMSIIRADPKSEGKVLQDLALIVVARVKKTSEETLATIDKLLQSSPKEELVPPLLECKRLYHVVMDVAVPLAQRATWGNPKFAETAMADSKWEAEICEQGFKGAPSPLSAENKYMGEIAAIARGIIRNLL